MAFTAGTLPTIDSCVSKVQSNLNRGSITTTSKPTLSDVQGWLIRAKQKLAEEYSFTWKHVFAYMDTSSSEYRYALPSDFGEGGHVLRDTTNDVRLTYLDPVSFDSIFVDVSGNSSNYPDYYTIKSNELWLSQPAGGTYRLELEYERTGDDTSATDVSYIPEVFRFKMCDYATYRGFIALEMWDAATAYKSEWTEDLGKARKRDSRKKWKSMGYQVRKWFI